MNFHENKFFYSFTNELNDQHLTLIDTDNFTSGQEMYGVVH